MTKRATTFLIAIVLAAGALMFALTARNDGCLPWQERIGYGDGPLGPGDDWSGCR